MTTITANYNHPHQQSSNGKSNSAGSTISHWLRADWSQQSPTVYVLGMTGYFLLLGSIAVIVLSNQFPWFMAAPITILLAATYLRHSDAKRTQQTTRP